MTVLLDENLDHALRTLLGPHDVVTVTYMGWSGLKNGELLRAAEDKSIEVFLTGDQTPYCDDRSLRHSVASYKTQPVEGYRCY